MLYLQTTFTENFSLALLTFTRLNKYITAKLFLPLGSCEFNNSTRSSQVVSYSCQKKYRDFANSDFLALSGQS